MVFFKNKDSLLIYGTTDFYSDEFKAMENMFERILKVNFFNQTSLLYFKDRRR